MSTKISKFIALVLRHNPEAGNLSLDAEGWTDTEALLAAIQSRGHHDFGMRELRELVENCDKQRYALSADGQKIRANQGHSRKEVDIKFEPVEPPEFLWHGTSTNVLDLIRENGLKPQSRQYVHLSWDQETATIVARRRKGPHVLLPIRAYDRLALGGLEFYRSANGVWLATAIAPEWILFESTIYL